ncbi:M57 family metalloprotease [Streptococcus sp. H49]|uniref:M57 family metalloprotease n=1 Tax=Streptococcus huangxiaojuni TaxID=3237239 RepID=UPI0034A53093
MKNLFRMILFIPRLIFRIIWHLFWGIVKTALVIAIILFALAYYANHSGSDLAQSFSGMMDNVAAFFADTKSDGLQNKLANLSTEDFTYYSGARWAQNSATVYIDTEVPTLINAYEIAIANWNATGAFTFTIVTNPEEADIIATDYSDSSSQAAGLAETEINAVTNQISHVDVKLNTYYLLNDSYGYTLDRIIHTAEHELGHAIGLAHDDSETSVMQSSGSYYGIQEADISAVQQLYAD